MIPYLQYVLSLSPDIKEWNNSNSLRAHPFMMSTRKPGFGSHPHETDSLVDIHMPSTWSTHHLLETATNNDFPGLKLKHDYNMIVVYLKLYYIKNFHFLFHPKVEILF